MDHFLFAVVLGLILLFALTNGFLDGGGMISTIVATRTLDPFTALAVAMVAEVAGLWLLGRAVARTVGLHLVAFPSSIAPGPALGVLLAAILAALLWNVLMWRLGFPSSSSHALLGGLVGAMSAAFGAAAVNWKLMGLILAGMAVVPVVATLLAFGFARAVYWAGQFVTPAASRPARILRIMALAGVAMAHGSNDGQKNLALVTLALSAAGTYARPPEWAWIGIALTLACGIFWGSRRTVQTLGHRLYRVQPLQGMCAEGATLMLVGASSLGGLPMASSHVLSSAILGAGVAVRPRGVRWSLAGDIVLAWVFTIPCAAGVGGLFSYVVSKAF